MRIDKKKIAVIHIVKKELNLSDDEYRQILKSATGVETSKDLDEVKFRKLMNVFMRSRHYQPAPKVITLRQKYYIRTLSKELDWTSEHLENFLKKYQHKGELDQLTKVEASKLIVSLKNIKSHTSSN